MILILFLLLCVAIGSMWWIAYGSKPFHPNDSWRKCPDCLRWHQKGRITYLASFTSNPIWEHCPECAAKRNSQHHDH